MLSCICGGVLELAMIVLAIIASCTGSFLVQWFHHRKCCGKK